MRLPPGHVHVWRARLDRPTAEPDRWRAILSDEERARLDRFRVPGAARQFAAARGLLRSLLGEYLAAAPEALTIAVAPGGKPHLPGDPLHFSVSHSGDLAVVAVSAMAIGVDVERVDPERALESIARRFFAREEVAALERLAGDERLRAFYRVWSRKEAYLKARGTGLAESLRGFTVSIEPGETVVGEWRLIDLDPGPDAIGVLATRDAGAQVIERDVSL